MFAAFVRVQSIKSSDIKKALLKCAKEDLNT